MAEQAKNGSNDKDKSISSVIDSWICKNCDFQNNKSNNKCIACFALNHNEEKESAVNEEKESAVNEEQESAYHPKEYERWVYPTKQRIELRVCDHYHEFIENNDGTITTDKNAECPYSQCHNLHIDNKYGKKGGTNPNKKYQLTLSHNDLEEIVNYTMETLTKYKDEWYSNQSDDFGVSNLGLYLGNALDAMDEMKPTFFDLYLKRKSGYTKFGVSTRVFLESCINYLIGYNIDKEEDIYISSKVQLVNEMNLPNYPLSKSVYIKRKTSEIVHSAVEFGTNAKHRFLTDKHQLQILFYLHDIVVWLATDIIPEFEQQRNSYNNNYRGRGSGGRGGGYNYYRGRGRGGRRGGYNNSGGGW